jgi:LuxR family maltose regulon positive regulatory protein
MGDNRDKLPQRTAVIHRQRLLRRLGGIVAPGVVVVCGPAAQGKTTLIADYLNTAGARSLWLHLGPEDSDTEHFARHLGNACRPHRISQDPVAADRDPQGAADDFSTPGGIAGLLQDLPSDLHLVFDGWHHIEASASRAEHIDVILASRPPESCLYLISRTNPALRLPHERMQGRALFISGDELAFTEEEIGLFYRTLQGVKLTAADCRQIRLLTGGWVGGLVLLAEELHRQPGREETILSAAALPERIHTEAGHYFEEEIFRPQAPAMRAFLVAAALLEEASAELMRAHLGRHDADHLFAEAARRNFFMQIVNADPRHWCFRFNPIFRIFLLSKARTLLSREKTAHFIHQAARHHEARGDDETAVPYFLQSGDTRAAVKGITRIGLQLAIDGRHAAIKPWIAMLPPTVVREDPWLGLLQAAAFRIEGGRRTIRELQKVYAEFDRSGHLRGKMLSLAYLIETAVFVGHDPARRAQWIALAEALVKEASRHPHFSYAKALLWQQIGLATIAESIGDIQKSMSACQNAVILAKGIAAPLLAANALTIAAHAHVQAGEYEPARARLQAAHDLDDGTAFSEYGAMRRLTAFHLALIQGQTGPAADLLQQVEADIDALGLMVLYPAYLEATGLLQILEKQYTALDKTRRHIQDVAILLNNPVYSALALWLAGLCCYHQGRFTNALALVRRALETPDLPGLHQARNRELLGFVALNSGKFTLAKQHFQDALGYFEAAGLTLSTCETHLGLALAQNAARDVAAAQKSLDLAFQMATARGYEHLPVIRPADMARACVLSIHLDVSSAVDHARHLLATRLVDAETQILETTPAENRLAQSIDADETRKTIYRARIPVLVIRTLGGLQILRRGTDPITPRAWQGSRPALLFKAILVHGGRHIPKDILIEALWPDRPPGQALQNFKVTLHRLRKLLEPDLNPALGSAYIHLQDNLVSLDARLCEVDTVAFHRLCKQARKIDPSVDTKTLLEMSQTAEALYQGDFLPEEPYLAWAELKRSTLREEFLQLMYRLGESLGDRQESPAARQCYRRIVRIDPAQEKAQRRLMQMLAEAGRSREALGRYREFRDYLATEIGAAPDAATKDLYRSIRDGLVKL